MFYVCTTFMYSYTVTDETMIAVDTEFLVHHSHHHDNLSLIQISTLNENYIIDAKAIKTELAILNQVFESEHIVKLFCGGGNDYRALLNANLRLKNVLDVQNMYKASSYFFPKTKSRWNPSFKQMCSDILGIRVSKKQLKLDWSRRPLLDAQLNYAVEDSKYLMDMGLILFEKLSKMQLESCATLSENQLSKLYFETKI